MLLTIRVFSLVRRGQLVHFQCQRASICILDKPSSAISKLILATHCTNRAPPTFSRNWQTLSSLKGYGRNSKTQAFVLAGASVWRGGVEEGGRMRRGGRRGSEFLFRGSPKKFSTTPFSGEKGRVTLGGAAANPTLNLGSCVA